MVVARKEMHLVEYDLTLSSLSVVCKKILTNKKHISIIKKKDKI